MIKANHNHVEIDANGHLLTEFSSICAGLLIEGMPIDSLYEGIETAIEAVEKVHREQRIVSRKELTDFMEEVKRIANAQKDKGTTDTNEG